jgi:hypothetical protein
VAHGLKAGVIMGQLVEGGDLARVRPRVYPPRVGNEEVSMRGHYVLEVVHQPLKDGGGCCCGGSCNRVQLPCAHLGTVVVSDGTVGGIMCAASLALFQGAGLPAMMLMTLSTSWGQEGITVLKHECSVLMSPLLR